MAMSSRRRERGGGLRRRRRCAGRTSKHRAFGESMRRRTRRSRARARRVTQEGRGSSAQVASVVLCSARAGLLRRREGKSGDREKRKRRTSGDYRRRLTRGRLGTVLLREVGDRRERYLGRERMALSTYVLVGYRRGSAYATEAGRKYFRVGARGSCRRVRGMARIYGDTGRLRREERGRRVAMGGRSTQGSRGMGRRMWVRRFKRGARPVHRWVADIYEGAPTMAGRYLRMVPKRSRRRVRVSLASRLYSEGRSTMLRRVCGRGSVRVGSRGRRVQRRWKRYMAYSGIGTVGNRRRGGLLRTAEGWKGRTRTLRTYRRMVRRRWGGRYRRGIRSGSHVANAGEAFAWKRERKYVTERRGRGKENPAMAMTRTGGRMSRVGRPPRLGFGAKRSVLRARVEQGYVAEEPRYREMAARALRRGVVSAYGYLRRVKRMRMEEANSVGVTGAGRRTRKVQKEGATLRGRGSYRRTVAWRNGEGLERAREHRGRTVRKRVR